MTVAVMETGGVTCDVCGRLKRAVTLDELEAILAGRETPESCGATGSDHCYHLGYERLRLQLGSKLIAAAPLMADVLEYVLDVSESGSSLESQVIGALRAAGLIAEDAA